MTIGAVVPLARAGDEHGHKAANLRWLIDHGYRVPDGIIVSSTDDETFESWVQPGQVYAVRSSASVEDGAEHSFAGQFASVLNVEGVAAIRDAIAEVMDSAADDRLRPYLSHAGVDPESVRMHVVVQHMVPARCAGVAFSRNPLTGLTDVLIEAVTGTGDALVSGTETPERWVRHWGEWTQQPDDPILPEEVAAELADAVAEMAEAWGAPIDIEWAWDGLEISWLQVRPMTATDVPVYSNRLAKEFLPGMIPPLVWSINVPVVNRAWLDLFESVVGPLELEPEDLSRQFAYRAYFAMGAVGDIFEAMSMPRDLLEVLLGIEGGDDRPAFRPRMGVVRHVPRMGRVGWRMARYHHELDRLMPQTQEELARLESRDLGAMSDKGLVSHLTDVEAVVRTVASANIVAPLLFNAYGAMLRRRLAKRGVDAEAIDLGAGQAGLGEYDPTPQLRELAAGLAQLDEDTRQRVREGEVELVPGMDAFLTRFGHVSDSGNDFSHQPWREDPSVLVPLLEVAAPATSAGEGEALPDDLSRIDRGLAGRAARYRLERERVSYTYTRSYSQFRPAVLEIARRLVERGTLDDVEQVFCLTRREMEDGLLHGRTALRELALARRAEMERLADVDMPEIIFGDEFEPAAPSDADHRLQGTPSSRGVVRTTARVVSGIEEADRVAPGEVVVIPYSDIGWTPMLAKAGAIVAESGGLLSHSSIVAREFGVPCVVSVPGAMRIPDGSIVRVDGYTGEIQWEPAA
jgi:pyruvate,water dikinase